MIDTLMTVTRPDGGTVGYYFYNEDTNVRDTLVTADGRIRNHHYTITVPEDGAESSILRRAMGKTSCSK